MAFVQVPPDSTGKKVDTNTIGATERQIAAIGDAVSSSGLAVVTTSAGLMVNLSSGLVTLSSNPTVVSASSGFVQVYTTGPLTLSGTVTVVSASSGFVQALTSGPLSLSSGIVTLSSNPTVISASSGQIQVLPRSTEAVLLSANYVSSSSNSSTSVTSGSPGTFFGFYAMNTTNVVRWLKVYGTSSAPAAGTLTSAILGIYGIPASTGTGGAGAQHIIQPFGLYGTGGIAFTVTANAAATDTGTTGANDLAFTLYYV